MDHSKLNQSNFLDHDDYKCDSIMLLHLRLDKCFGKCQLMNGKNYFIKTNKNEMKNTEYSHPNTPACGAAIEIKDFILWLSSVWIIPLAVNPPCE